LGRSDQRTNRQILGEVRPAHQPYFEESELWSLGQEELGLLDALVERRITGS
jgi:hypothetical protein